MKKTGYSKERSIPLNFLMNFLLKLSGTLCAAISYPYAFRMIGSEGMGKVAFTTSIAGFFVMLASMGIPTYGIRECARVRGDPDRLGRTVRELLTLQLMTTLAAILLLAASVWTIPRLRGEWRIFLIQGGMIAFHGLDTEWLFSAMERYGFLALRSFVTKLLSVVLVILFVRGPEDYLFYALCLALPTVLGNLWNLAAMARAIQFPGWDGRFGAGRHFRPVLVFFAQAAAVTVYTNLDAALLGFLRGDAVVGNYDAAVKIKLILTYFITSLGTVLLPRFSFYLAENREQEFRRGIGMSGEFILVSAFPLMIFFLWMAPECLRALYKTLIPDTLYSLRILLFTLPLIGFSNLTGIQLLTPLGRERIVMRSVIVGAVVNFAADLILISLMGAPGAALGTVIAEATVLAVQYREVRRLEIRFISGKNLLLVLAVSALASSALLLLKTAQLPPLAGVAAGACAFFGIAFAALAVAREPIASSVFQRLARLVGIHR